MYICMCVYVCVNFVLNVPLFCMLSVIFIHVRFIFRSITGRTNLGDRDVLGGSSI
jgi:hypothetical protein